MKKLISRVALSIGCLLLFETSAQPATPRTVALLGNQAAGMPPGTAYTDFSSVLMNSSGRVAFFAETSRDSGINSGIWTESDGSLKLVADIGRRAPGTPDGVVFSSMGETGPHAFNDDGQLAFWARLKGNTINFENGAGLWAGDATSFKLIAREGDQAPGVPKGATLAALDSFEPPLIDAAGNVAFSGAVVGGGLSSGSSPYIRGIWHGNSASLGLVVRDGDPAPGTHNGEVFSLIYDHGTKLNSSGIVSFRAGLKGPTIDGSNFEGLWVGRPGALRLLHRQGDRLPGMPPDAVSYGPSSFDVSDSETIAFVASWKALGEDNYQSGVWSDRNGSLELVLQSGDHAPGTPDETRFAGFDPSLNSAGRLAIRAGLDGIGVNNKNDRGIWSDASGSLKLVAREGDRPPGAPERMQFDSFESLEFNSAGQIAFVATLARDGIQKFDKAGIWAQDRSGTLQLIAQRGDNLEVAPNDLRMISWIYLYGFNDKGQLGFGAHFGDGSQGLFVTDLVAVPEPDAFLLMAASALAFAHSRRTAVMLR